MANDIFIKDKRDRVLVHLLDNGKVIYYRYPDLCLEEKNMMIDVLSDLCIGDKKEISDYLNFFGEDEFCS